MISNDEMLPTTFTEDINDYFPSLKIDYSYLLSILNVSTEEVEKIKDTIIDMKLYKHFIDEEYFMSYENCKRKLTYEGTEDEISEIEHELSTSFSDVIDLTYDVSTITIQEEKEKEFSSEDEFIEIYENEN